jgi:hypothetical protein
MKKLILILSFLFMVSTAYASMTLYDGNVVANKSVFITQRVFAVQGQVTVTFSIPCNVTLTPTFLLGLGRNYSYPVVVYSNVTSFTVSNNVVYMLEVVPLQGGELVVTETYRG